MKMLNYDFRILIFDNIIFNHFKLKFNKNIQFLIIFILKLILVFFIVFLISFKLFFL